MVEVEVAASNFKVTSGAELMKTFGEDGFSPVCFCTHCGSSLYAGGGDSYYVAAGALPGLLREPSYHMMVAYKAPWDEITGTAPQYPDGPPES